MEKEFVPYELALKLKPIGFSNSYSIGGYQGGAVFYYEEGKLYYDGRPMYSSDSHAGQIDAPLYQQAFRWFREKGYRYTISFDSFMKNGMFYFEIWENGKCWFETDFDYNTYEEAELACLNKLIEIVESQKE